MSYSKLGWGGLCPGRDYVQRDYVLQSKIPSNWDHASEERNAEECYSLVLNGSWKKFGPWAHMHKGETTRYSESLPKGSTKTGCTTKSA